MLFLKDQEPEVRCAVLNFFSTFINHISVNTFKTNFLPIFNGTAIGIMVLVFIAMIFGKSLSGLLTNKQISIICGLFFLLYALIFFVDKKLAKIMHVDKLVN